MFALGSSDSDSEDDVRVGPYTMEEAILDVTKRKRLPIEHRHSCISSFRHYDATSSYKNSSESSYTTAYDTVHNESHHNAPQSLVMTETPQDTSEESVLEDFHLDQPSIYNLTEEENLDTSRLESVSRKYYTLYSESGTRDSKIQSISDDSETTQLTSSTEGASDPKDVHEVSYDSPELEQSIDSLQLGSNGESKASNTQNQYMPWKPTLDNNRLSNSLSLDDTLEELNQFIDQGPDYVMSPKSVSPPQFLKAPCDWVPLARSTGVGFSSQSSTSYSSKSDTDSQVFKSRLPTPKFIGHKKKGYSAEKSSVKTNSVEKANSKSTVSVKKASSKTLFTKSPYKSEFDFKVPEQPINRTPKPNLKNVVSPVGIYINYTPKYFPLVKVTASPKRKVRTKLYEPEPPSKENIPTALNCEIPPVIYKPAALRMVSEEEDVNLPGSIKKLVSPQVVTKHERRIGRHQHDISIERRLLESDLSISVNDDNPDVSVVVNKQPFNIKKW